MANTTTTDRNHPHKPVPEHLSTNKDAATKDEKIDAQMEDSFPASDPPSYSGGNHAVGAPQGRESEGPGPETPSVTDAEKKLKDNKPKDTGKY